LASEEEEIFQKDGGGNKMKTAATVIFVPSTRDSILLKSLKAEVTIRLQG
jgi:hypothetical protein